MSEEVEDDTKRFHEMGLDDRLLKAIAKLGWANPTPIQEKAIPLALEGKDVLARARTGSGKTAAFVIPVIQKILISKQLAKEQCTKALLMAPTRELCNQAMQNIVALTSSCSREVRCVDVSGQASLEAQRPLLREQPDIVVGTPSRILAHIKADNLSLKSHLEMVIIDEADLVFSFGYEDDIKELVSHFPKIYQAFLMSATLGDDVKALKRLVLHNAITLKLQESQLPETSQLTQYHINCDDDDKFVLMYTLFKLNLIRGKTIIFVNTVNRCYKLKLYFEQFSIRSCVLNSELPVKSRCHIVSQFNEGMYDIIIAADEKVLDTPGEAKAHAKRAKKFKKDTESGVSRGIDFQFVSNVINFDFPRDVDSYIHRVGRTARGSNEGTALSLVSDAEQNLLAEVEAALADTHVEGETIFKPYNFKMEEIEGFRTRAKDAIRAVTKVAVREARLKEIKSELLNSHKLKSYFEDNPRDFQVLRHDKALHTAKVQPHLGNVPDYLVPTTLKNMRRGSKPSTSKGRANHRRAPSSGQQKYQKRKADPLKSFQFAGLTKKRKT